MVEVENKEERDGAVGSIELPRRPLDQEVEGGEEGNGSKAQHGVPSLVELLRGGEDEEVERNEEACLKQTLPHHCWWDRQVLQRQH